jgi:hypothetical protein
MRARLLTIVGVLGLLIARDAFARPTYFAVFTGRYGLTSDDRTYACGNCHFRWTGTGARNPFGTAVEQQLYVGKSINQALQDIENDDSDGDGFTNVDEIVNFKTLPGYSCANFQDAVGAPADYHSFITPMVASCLEPLDIRIAPSQLGFLTDAGVPETLPVTVFNNGQDDPIIVNAYGLLPGAHPAFSVSGPTAPFVIPVGQSVVLNVTFAPPGGVFGAATLRVSSNDPDEADIDVPMNGFGVVHVLAPAAARAACLRDLDIAFRRYSKKHLKAWSECYLDEVAGLACDSGQRDLVIQQAAQKLRDAIGGSKDRRCTAAGITPSLLGYPSTCGGSCGSIQVNSMGRLVDCVVCREDEGMADMLRAGIGTAPPDLPPNTVGSARARACQKQILGAAQKGIAALVKTLARCEIANVTASTPVDCATTLASQVAVIKGKADAPLASCGDTSGLDACPFEPPNDPTCLGQSVESVGSSLVDATVGFND